MHLVDVKSNQLCVVVAGEARHASRIHGRRHQALRRPLCGHDSGGALCRCGPTSVEVGVKRTCAPDGQKSMVEATADLGDDNQMKTRSHTPP